MSSVPVKTPAEVLEELRRLILKNSDARVISIHVFGWACGVCSAAGVTLDELAGFIRKYQNNEYEKGSDDGRTSD